MVTGPDRFQRRTSGVRLAPLPVQSLPRTSPELLRGSSRRSAGLRWIPTKIPDGRLAPVTSRSTIWFWSDSSMCQKARGSATFASIDLSNRRAQPLMPNPPRHVLSSSFSPFSSFHSVFPHHVLFALYPHLRIPIFMGCFLKRRVVGCHGVPHCPKFPFSSSLSDPSGR